VIPSFFGLVECGIVIFDCAMSTVAEIESAIAKLPPAEKAEVVMSALRQLYPHNEKAVRRALFRLEHPEIPEEFAAGMEELEDGKGIEMTDEHFVRPPV
jgi:hypothetical protein